MKARTVSPPRKAAAHAVSVAAGRLTSGARMTPAFLIVGAQRGGTTSMYRTLSQHPAIVKAVLHKGVHYFDLNAGQGMGWYRAHFPLKAQALRVRRATGVSPLTFESSPYYMFHPLAPVRIARALPGVKLLVLVRDPVERAYSAHAHELARGFETEPFERALALEAGRIAGEAERMVADPAYLSTSYQHHAYRLRGHYSSQLDRLESIFGRDRIHVVDSGDFFTDPAPVYDRVLEFLGLPNLGSPRFERHNARPRPAMSESLRAELDAEFAEPDSELERWLGQAPSWRR